jgi:hypothetical protein
MEWRRQFNTYLGPSYLRGLRLSDWLKLLLENELQISPRYLLRALSITGVSSVNSLLSPLENLLYSSTWKRQVVPPPVFVVGLGRSGTTHLFQLLACDTRFGFPNTFQVSFPHIFLTAEKLLSPLLSILVSPHRIQDKVKVSLETPAEDELALMALTGMSPLLGRIFPKSRGRYVGYRSFREVSQRERDIWKAALYTYCQKLTVKQGKPLLLKSPVHTSRVALILELFPEARFLHIHRHPYDVLRSQLHSRQVTTPNWRLQSVADETRTERALDTFEDIANSFLTDKALLKPEQLCEVSYTDLITDRCATLSRVYSHLNLPSFDDVRPHIQAFVDGLGEYKKNVHAPLDCAIKEKLHSKARCWMEEYGYRPD